MFSSEKEYLKHYNIHDYDVPLVSVDLAIFTLINGKLHILLIERADFPYKDRWALPGGFIDLKQDKDISATALRKLTEKTGVKVPHLEQVCTIGNNKRDPRGWSVTALYMALIPFAPTAEYVASVRDARWWPLDAALKLPLAFDHVELVNLARERLRVKTGYSLLPVFTINSPFTLTQLQQAFEEILGKELDKKSFRRRIQNVELLEEVGEGMAESGRGRSAILYRPTKGSEQHAFVRAFGQTDESI
jgi:8-oxo-dGTP diphosphatase